MAERGGFEPPVRLPAHTLSKRAPSAARTPLRERARLSLWHGSTTRQAENCTHPAAERKTPLAAPRARADNAGSGNPPAEFAESSCHTASAWNILGDDSCASAGE